MVRGASQLGVLFYSQCNGSGNLTQITKCPEKIVLSYLRDNTNKRFNGDENHVQVNLKYFVIGPLFDILEAFSVNFQVMYKNA